MQKLFYHGIDSSEKAVKAGKNAFYASLFSGIATIIYGFFLSSAEFDLLIGSLLTGGLSIIFGIFTLKMNKISSILLFTLFLVDLIIRFIDGTLGAGIFVALVILYYYLIGIFGCFLYPKLLQEEGKVDKKPKNKRIGLILSIIGLLLGLVFFLAFFSYNPNLKKYPELLQAEEVYFNYSDFSVKQSHSIYKEYLEKDLSGQLLEINNVDEKRLKTIKELTDILNSIKEKKEEPYISGVKTLGEIIKTLEQGELEVIEIQKNIAQYSTNNGNKKKIEELEQEMGNIMEKVYEVKDKRDEYIFNIE